MAQPTLLSIETLRFTKAPFATDVFALGVHFRGAPRSDAITVKHRACVVLVAQVCEGKGAFLARIKTRVSSASELWNHGSYVRDVRSLMQEKINRCLYQAFVHWL